jgi:hypothetical protein
MAHSFLKDFRRRSKASIHTDESINSSNGPSNGFHGSVLTPSSSTVN